MKSPPGGGILAAPKRASNGPASRNEARIWLESSSSTTPSVTPAAQSLRLLSPTQATSTPSCSSRAICASVSRMRGTRCSSTSSSVRRQAARIGRAAFLLPATVTSPDSGAPPWMTNFSMGCGLG